MNTAEVHDDDTDGRTDGRPEPLTVAPDLVEVRRNAGLAAVVGAAASAVAIAYLSRAAGSGALLDWALVAVLGVLAAGYLRAFVDARTPLLVADAQGVRIRLGRTWRGLPWGALSEVTLEPRRGLVRDGRLVLVPRNLDRMLGEIDGGGRRQVALSRALYGDALAVPLGLSTRVIGADGDLAGALRELAGDRAVIAEIVPVQVEDTAEDPADEQIHQQSPEEVHEPGDWVETLVTDADPSEPEKARPGRTWPDPRPALAAGISSLAARFTRDDTDDDTDSHGWDDIEVTQPLVASATPSPLRDVTPARRTEITSEVHRDLVHGANALDLASAEDAARRGLPEADHLRRGHDLMDDTVAWHDGVRPIAVPGHPVEPLVIDDLGAEAVPDPVIGPEFLAARTRLGLSVDQLAERTRIRPHVIESIEVDDFVPCGGDFYARGHLRTLARVLGIDVNPLLETYDERYADAPISPRRVFEAELATGSGGSIRATGGGTNWSLLIGVVMVLVLVWSIARLVMNDPSTFEQPAPDQSSSNGAARKPAAVIATPVVVEVTATKQVHVVVRDGNGEVVFTDDLTKGQSNRVRAEPPVSVRASDGGALRVQVDGQEHGRLGAPGRAAQVRFQAD